MTADYDESIYTDAGWEIRRVTMTVSMPDGPGFEGPPRTRELLEEILDDAGFDIKIEEWWDHGEEGGSPLAALDDVVEQIALLPDQKAPITIGDVAKMLAAIKSGEGFALLPVDWRTR